MQTFNKTIDRALFRNGTKNNSPRWALLEGFRVPNADKPDVDYLWRLRIIQCPLGGVYLHKLSTPDPRDTLHNHPFTFCSFILRGGYTEFIPDEIHGTYARSRHIKRFNMKRFNKSWHWISELDRYPTWTLVFVGRRRRVWQYMDRDGTVTDFNLHPHNDAFAKALDRRAGGGDMV